jgi:ribosomal protein S18 acetylase RimI-like enzyme
MDTRRDSASALIRPWVEADLASIRRVTWETWLETYASFIPLEDLRSYFERQYDLPSLTAFFRAENAGGFVAEWGGAIAGYARTHIGREDNRFYVASLYVLPGMQGRGLGTRLLSAADLLARGRHGADRIWLGVMEQNVRTVEWYERTGFQFVEQAPFTMGKTTVNHLIGYRIIQ